MPTQLMKRDKHTVLKDIFGYSAFRPIQEEIINHTMDGFDSLVIMPTGGGKSLCYQIPGILLAGMTVVISPLIALMEDQVTALNQLGVKAEAIHSNQNGQKLKEIVHAIDHNDIDILYISPERFASGRFLEYLKEKNISLIAIDEAHCVSVWGNDFRPDYAALSILRANFEKVPIIALTATADKATQDDIAEQLRLNKHKLFLSSFERKNIFIEVRSGVQRKEQILSFIKNRPDESGIIYCLSRKSTEKVCFDLKRAGIKAAHYHAGMDAQSRQKVQVQFQNDEVEVVCATIAFGMGIDKSNIKWVIHYNMPKNLESYYQEIGRSGRDGSAAEALLFYSWGDFLQYKRFIDEGEGNDEFKFVQNAKLRRMWEFVNSSDCRTNVILNYFGEYRNEGCGHCDNCKYPPQKFDGLIITQKAISAVIRSKESLSMLLLIDVLRGSHRQEIIQNGFDKIKTFGAGRDLTFAEWREYLTQIIDKGYLMIDYKNRLKIKTTPLSKSVLKNETAVLLKKFEKIEEREVHKKIRERKKTKLELLEEDMAKEIKKWRQQKAESLSVAPYHLMSDIIVTRIIESKPFFKDELRELEGIGKESMKIYGADLIEFLQSYFARQSFKKNLKGKTYLQTLDHYRQGMSPEQISDLKGVHLYTIYSHFAYLYQQGIDIEISSFITSEQIERVRKAIEISGNDDEQSLKKILGDGFQNYLIRIAKALLSRSKN